MSDELPEYLTARECARVRRRTPAALSKERERGVGPPYVIDGGRVLYPRDALIAYLDARRIVPGGDTDA